MEKKPATSRQTYALKLATGIDYRDKNLSFEEASKLIKEANEKSGYQNKKQNKKIPTILDFLASPESIEKLKSCICNEIEIKSIITNVKNNPESIKEYIFLGSGCGFSFLRWDKRNTKANMVIQKANEIRSDIDKLVSNYFDKEVLEYLQKCGNPIEVLQAQNMNYHETYNNLIIKYLKDYYDIDGIYSDSRLD